MCVCEIGVFGTGKKINGNFIGKKKLYKILICQRKMTTKITIKEKNIKRNLVVYTLNKRIRYKIKTRMKITANSNNT